jgi:hypothetical protein
MDDDSSRMHRTASWTRVRAAAEHSGARRSRMRAPSSSSVVTSWSAPTLSRSSLRHVANTSVHASITSSWGPMSSQTSSPAQMSFSVRARGASLQDRPPALRQRTRAARRSWPSRKMRAWTGVVSPTEVFGRPAPPGVAGRTWSITIAPREGFVGGTDQALPHRGARYNGQQVICPFRDRPAAPELGRRRLHRDPLRSSPMKALRSFTVRPTLPPELAPLEALAMNLRWSWDLQTRELFRWVDPDEWDAVVHDPVRLLGNIAKDRLAELVQDRGFLRFLETVQSDLERYLSRDAWFQGRSDSPLRAVAYFSPEFGISEAVPQYSGGLGVLAGDHLKAASDLGLPLVGIGLMYRNGYFRQALNVEGWQEQRYPNLDPYAMALTLQDGVRVRLDLAGRPLTAQVWKAEVGRTVLYLLDSDVDDNDDDLRAVTDRLYGGDSEHRLRQEMLLGIGGVRALRALGVDTQVFHTNEGHAGFLGLERIRELMAEGLRYEEALEAVRAGSVFTTHTPVPAGIDRFPRELIERYFAGFAAEAGITMDQLLELGHEPGDAGRTRFNMAVMGLRLAARSNGVARLHGNVSREMFQPLWPQIPVDEVPIGHVTNGVHARTWVSAEMNDLLTRHVHPHWGRPTRRSGPASTTSPTTRCGGSRSRARTGSSPSCATRSAPRRRPAASPAPTSAGPTRSSTTGPSPSASPAASPPTSGRPCCSPSPSG